MVSMLAGARLFFSNSSLVNFLQVGLFTRRISMHANAYDCNALKRTLTLYKHSPWFLIEVETVTEKFLYG